MSIDGKTLNVLLSYKKGCSKERKYFLTKITSYYRYDTACYATLYSKKCNPEHCCRLDCLAPLEDSPLLTAFGLKLGQLEYCAYLQVG